MGRPSFREQALKAIEIDPREASEILAELQIKASEATAQLENPAQQRLLEAHRRELLIERIVRRVGSMHGLAPDVVRRPPSKIKNRHHVVMARSHAAWLMRNAGLTHAVIGRALRTCGSQGKRYSDRWSDHRAGVLSPVTEAQAREVKALVAQGQSVSAACSKVGVGISRYEARLVSMRRDAAKSEAQDHG
ncbi:hypothetical protein [uncultured Hyphomicrobium sp.]|uniref:hypothetical protein n=1 Tax=uncultured Hyphomicrobium sp. TaxID=194373 RepID=UPI0025CE78C0|nr:hypothetical protein [uncultured Hyphomicrobium sp.]